MLFKNHLIKIFWKFGIFQLLMEKNSHPRYVIMFHGISKSKVSKVPADIQPHLDIREFSEIIEWLNENFDFLNPDQLLNTNKPGILLTFDDGFNNNFTNVLPVIEKYEIPAIFFITTQHVAKPNEWLHFAKTKIHRLQKEHNSIHSKDNISDWFDGISIKNLKEMADSSIIEIGSHTISHPLLTETSADQIENELVLSRTFLEGIIKKPVKYFAYPSGNYNSLVISKVREAGYEAAFGIDKINHLGHPIYEIPRIGIYSSELSYLYAKFSGIYQKPIKRLK